MLSGLPRLFIRHLVHKDALPYQMQARHHLLLLDLARIPASKLLGLQRFLTLARLNLWDQRLRRGQLEDQQTQRERLPHSPILRVYRQGQWPLPELPGRARRPHHHQEGTDQPKPLGRNKVKCERENDTQFRLDE
jgi:hypothetical protein